MPYCCSNPWTTFFVWGNGDVTHCCYSSWGVLGNVKQESLEAIWMGRRWEALRETMARGDFAGAGCEPWCRVVRWNRYYGDLPEPPPIPEGLGRIEDGQQPDRVQCPSIVGLATPWMCDLRCTHCLSSRHAPGLAPEAVDRLWPWVEEAEVVRLMDGEFTINSASLALLRRIGAMARQPRVFMNTHALTPLDRWWNSVDDLRAFHLKCSLEGTGEAYERIRKGGSWVRFEANLAELRRLFLERTGAGKDWKLFLNACAMSSNLASIPGLVRFAVQAELPLVLNVLHGARHLDENFGAYAHLAWQPARVADLRSRIEAELPAQDHPWAQDVRWHVDYVIRTLQDRQKVALPSWARRWLGRRHLGLAADRLLGLWLRWHWDPRGAVLSLQRKVRKRLRGGWS